MLIFIRILHIFIGLFFLVCLGYLYYSAFSDNTNWLTFFSFWAIVFEGLLLFFNKGQCPLTEYQKKLGDDKGFFALFLPAKALPFVVPVFIVLTAISLILILINSLI